MNAIVIKYQVVFWNLYLFIFIGKSFTWNLYWCLETEHKLFQTMLEWSYESLQVRNMTKKKNLPQIKFVQFYKIGPVEYLANIVQLEEQLVT